MGYKLLGMFVWNGGKWFARRKVNGTSTGQRVGFLAGLTALTSAFVFLLARSGDDGE